MKILLLLMSIILLSTSCERKGCTNLNSFNYDPEAVENDGSCQEMYGCLGYTSNMTNSGSLGTTLYDSYYDSKMNEEVNIQKSFFQNIPANVYILYEPNPSLKNAYASPDGTIRFGYYMHYYTISLYGELPVAGILAHEFGHRVQFTLGWDDYDQNSFKELEADAFSGFYLAIEKQWAWSQIQNYYSNVYAAGDYNFNHPTHHGTPQQRLMAAYYGVQIGLNALQTGKKYTYKEIHDLFLNEIINNISPSEKSKIKPIYKEITYPKNLTKRYIESIYPNI